MSSSSSERRIDPLPRPEQIHPSVFVAPGAVVVGDVTLAEGCSVWFQSVLRGDTERIQLGPGCNIQDGSILHADPGFPCVLGAGVSVGHGAIVHGALVSEDVLIGMRAVVMNGAEIGPECLIGVGALVTAGVKIPAGSLVLGMPGKVARKLTPEERDTIRQTAAHYREFARAYLAAQNGS